MELRTGSEGSSSLPGEGTGSGAPGNREDEDRRRVGLLGGSFDPVHAGHLFVASMAQEHAGLDEVLFVPAARPPHKPDRVLTPGPDRLALLEAALEGEGGLRVVDLELGREGPSYTIDTVRALEEQFGGQGAVELHLILGGDNLEGMGTWREASALLERVTPIVVHRGEDLEGALERIGGDLPEHLLEKLKLGLLEVEPHAASSTKLREQLGRREDPGEHLPAGCLEIVKGRSLYGWTE